MEEKSIRPFGMKDKIGYMFGDFGNDFTFLLSTVLMSIFYSDVMGVSPGLVGVVMMVARFVDAFTDVTMGQIVDRSKPTKAGKFKPWILRMCGPVAISSLLIYGSWFKDMPMGFKVAYMFITYILWGSFCYTGVNIPYGSMASAITNDPQERQSLSTFRTMGGMLAGMIINVIVPMVIYKTVEVNGELVNVLDGGRSSIVAAFCSVGAVVCYLLCYNLCTERVKVEQKIEKFEFKKLFKNLISNKALIGIVLASICQLLVQLTSQTMNTYIYTKVFNSPTAQSLAGIVSMVPMLLVAGVIGKLTQKFGKKELAVVGSIFGAIVFVLMFIMRTDSPWVFVAMYGVSCIGLAIFAMICWAMITDVIDDTEVRQGVRSDGEIYSIYSFARKLGQAAAAGVSGALLSMIGYDGTLAVQTDAVKSGIYNISTLVPAIGFLLLAVVLQFLYPLNKKRVEENVKILAEKRKN